MRLIKLLPIILINLLLAGKALPQKHDSNNQPASQQNKDPVVFLKGFLKWYKTKVKYLNQELYPLTTDLKKERPYCLDFKKVEMYLTALKSSGYFSDSYIDNRRMLFKSIDQNIRQLQKKDLTILDFDRIVNSREPESVLKNLKSIQLTPFKTATDTTIVSMVSPLHAGIQPMIYLSKHKGKYQIENIDYEILYPPF